MEQKYSDLDVSERIILAGHCLNAIGVLLLSIGTILRAAGNLPNTPHPAGNFAQRESRMTAKDYFKEG